MPKLQIHTDQRDYTAEIEPGLISEAGQRLYDFFGHCKAVIVTDSYVDAYGYADVVQKQLCDAGLDAHKFVFPAEEINKNMKNVDRLVHMMTTYDMTRSDILVAVGGGIVGDLTGFTASIYLRGIHYVQIPTTLLSAVDASVGGKCAVNLPAGKNMLGTFWQPSMVLCDTQTFRTLSRGMISNGMAEAVKFAILHDADFFAEIEQEGLNLDMSECVARCIRIKSEIIGDDKYDTGRRRLTNFGHTVGHAIEKLGNMNISHGHAVAIGMTVMTKAAEQLGMVEEPCYDRLVRTLRKCELPTVCPFSAEAMANAALRDKKRAGHYIDLSFATRIGAGTIRRFPVAELADLFAKGL